MIKKTTYFQFHNYNVVNELSEPVLHGGAKVQVTGHRSRSQVTGQTEKYL